MRKIYRNLTSIALSLLLMLTLSCKKTKTQPMPEPEKNAAFAVEKIQAAVVKNIDLSTRKNTRVVLRDHQYNYTVSDSKIIAAPVKEPYLLPYSVDRNGAIEPIQEEKALWIQLMSVGYMSNMLKEGPLPRPVIKDQNTEEDLVNADMLGGFFYGAPSKDLSGVNLTHANNLLDFEVKDMPDGSDLALLIRSRGDQFKPLKVKNNQYTAVISGSWFTPADVSVALKIGSDTYTVKVLDQKGIKQDRHYKFTIRFNNHDKSLSVENFTETKWSDEKWPK